MIEVSNLTAQTLQPGQAVTFDRIVLRTAYGAECFNAQVPTSIKLCAKGIYELHFNGNVTSPTAGAAVQLAMAVNNSPLVETAMNEVITAANNLKNVSTSTLFRNGCCDLDRISIINTGSVPVTLAPNSNFYVTRRS